MEKKHNVKRPTKTSELSTQFRHQLDQKESLDSLYFGYFSWWIIFEYTAHLSLTTFIYLFITSTTPHLEFLRLKSDDESSVISSQVLISIILAKCYLIQDWKFSEKNWVSPVVRAKTKA